MKFIAYQSTSAPTKAFIQEDETTTRQYLSSKQDPVQLISTGLESQKPCPGLSYSNEQNHAMPILNISRLSLRQFEQQGIVASFVQDIFPLGQSTVQLSFIGSWLWHVPQALQKSRTMDEAAEALALAYFAKKTESKEALMRSQCKYSSALTGLSKALQCPRSRFASETLCATLLFVHYEVREHRIT
jgi:hypothetical protein